MNGGRRRVTPQHQHNDAMYLYTHTRVDEIVNTSTRALAADGNETIVSLSASIGPGKDWQIVYGVTVHSDEHR